MLDGSCREERRCICIDSMQNGVQGVFPNPSRAVEFDLPKQQASSPPVGGVRGTLV